MFSLLSLQISTFHQPIFYSASFPYELDALLQRLNLWFIFFYFLIHLKKIEKQSRYLLYIQIFYFSLSYLIFDKYIHYFLLSLLNTFLIDKMSGEIRESRRRNAKIQPLERGYGCPCGKTYLSYPALFTHIKQKHEGKAPGDIIKPKNQQTRRGRPRTNSISLTEAEEPFEMSDNPLQHIQEVIQNQEVQPSTLLVLKKAEPGRSTVTQILNLFLQESSSYLSQTGQSILSGFLQIIKITVNNSNQNNYCESNDASQIIESANQIIRQCYSRQKNDFTMSRDGTIQLTKLFFQWLYKNNLTDHIIEEQSNARLEI